MSSEELTKKKSEFQVYRDLKWQEKENPKNKWDNRLYFSLRYKTLNYTDEKMDELFKKRVNHETFVTVIVRKINFKEIPICIFYYSIKKMAIG
jgi:hypothetical protein